MRLRQMRIDLERVAEAIGRRRSVLDGLLHLPKEEVRLRTVRRGLDRRTQLRHRGRRVSFLQLQPGQVDAGRSQFWLELDGASEATAGLRKSGSGGVYGAQQVVSFRAMGIELESALRLIGGG